jgi:argininosuccinate lyase
MNNSEQLWGGRFTEGQNETFRRFNNSLKFDCRLFVADVSASIAHANAIEKAGIISHEEREQIVEGLTKLLEEESLLEGYFDESDAEDVHSFIEGRLTAAIGDAGRKLHTGRSRNDQVATAFRLWVRYEIDSMDRCLHDLQKALVEFAEQHSGAVIPGYTHLQRAQSVLFAHWCLAYFEMLKRDRERIADARKRVNILPLGSGALAGTGFPIDREAVAAELGFTGVTANSLDAVSDRDFCVEFVSCCSLIMMHLSRLAEDMILYCSNEFGFMTLSDAVSSGSSLMPQKKNPDALELIRGKAGRVFGSNVALLTMLKGLPLAYNKDMQEDKEAVFDAVDTVRCSLPAAITVVKNATLIENATRAAASRGYLNATDLADYLVKKGVPFRIAHEMVGKLVLRALEQGKELNEMPIESLREISPEIGDDVFDALSVEASVGAKNAIGGTAPERVGAALQNAKKYLDD